VTRELLGFFAPPRQLVRSALIGAGISGVLLLLHLEALSLPALSLWFAWWLGGSFGHIAIQPISYWDQSWPVPHRLLLRTRILAAWLASCVPTLALVITASALYRLGIVSELAWARTASHALCVLGLVPLACAAAYRFSDRPQSAPVYVAALILLPSLALEAFVTLSGLDESRSAAALLRPALIIGLLTGLAGVLLTRAWVASPPLAASPARQRPSRSVRSAFGAAGPHWSRGVLRGPFGFFYLHPRPLAVLAWVLFLLVGGLDHFRLSGVMFFVGSSLWFHAYDGATQPSPLPAHLPIPRQRVLGYLLAPLAALVLLGGALEQFWPTKTYNSRFSVGRYADDLLPASSDPKDPYRILAPSFVWRVSWGEPPLVTTPRGVSRRPAALAVLPGLPLNVYNPYDARLDDDPAFVNHQVSRIMTREWHLDVSAEDVERACHAVQRDQLGRSCLERELVTSYRRPGAWPAIQCWLLCIVCLLTLRLQTSGPLSPRKPLEWVAPLGCVVTLALLPAALSEVGKNDPTGLLTFPFRGAVLLGELARLAERAPLASSLVGLVLLLGFYRLVERRFVRMEGFAGRRRSAL
jgi:hypothetical protein